jgi:hypothetical protein
MNRDKEVEVKRATGETEYIEINQLNLEYRITNHFYKYKRVKKYVIEIEIPNNFDIDNEGIRVINLTWEDLLQV